MEKGSEWKGSEHFEDYFNNGYVHGELHQTISLIYSMHQNNINVSPFDHIYDITGDEECWFYEIGGRYVTFKNVDVKSYHGISLRAITESIV